MRTPALLTLTIVFNTFINLYCFDTRRRKWQPILVFLPEESHGQRSQAGYSPWGRKELDTTKWLTHHFDRVFVLCLTWPGLPWKQSLLIKQVTMRSMSSRETTSVTPGYQTGLCIQSPRSFWGTSWNVSKPSILLGRREGIYIYIYINYIYIIYMYIYYIYIIYI